LALKALEKQTYQNMLLLVFTGNVALRQFTGPAEPCG